MNLSDYITSGMLEEYCLGLLTDEEEKKLEAVCSIYPEVAKELQLLQLALEKYAGSDFSKLREELRPEIWKAIEKYC